jgi:hypothetical protein
MDSCSLTSTRRIVDVANVAIFQANLVEKIFANNLTVLATASLTSTKYSVWRSSRMTLVVSAKSHVANAGRSLVPPSACLYAPPVYQCQGCSVVLVVFGGIRYQVVLYSVVQHCFAILNNCHGFL